MPKSSTRPSVVLAVDDSPDALGLISRILEAENMTTLVALDGHQAINIASKMQPDIILLDALMPNIDGFETCKRLKAIADVKNVPVIFMTGLSDTDSVVKGFEAGGIDFLTKPIEPKELLVRMKTHLTIARANSDAQQALDYAGQNIIALDSIGNYAWSTPQVEKLLEKFEDTAVKHELLDELRSWLDHLPKKGNKMQFSTADDDLSAVYIGLSEGGDHLIRLVSNVDVNQSTVLKDSFNITVRESDVFLWIARGKTNREIAQILEMSPRTVNKHLEQLFKKINVENRTAAAGLAIQCLQQNNLL